MDLPPCGFMPTSYEDMMKKCGAGGDGSTEPKGKGKKKGKKGKKPEGGKDAPEEGDGRSGEDK
jgi:hypothetical protein